MTTIYTVGHSNHEAGRFVALLEQHGIEAVVDVRSSPYSRYVPQANREALARTLRVLPIQPDRTRLEEGAEPRQGELL